jgi:hypothetical protein
MMRLSEAFAVEVSGEELKIMQAEIQRIAADYERDGHVVAPAMNQVSRELAI